ncbi:hypothetical protein M6B38_245505 [Iris pallida]|uniref:Uncharacterized protein n=1 Tax=Iris pallida TaxID=29817 RepID=A0AAX6DH48_IRIPA|nr:hypothetical protein M6B38_245505 [Iris pallida]
MDLYMRCYSPSGASGTLCLCISLTSYTPVLSLHVHSCESCTLMFTEPHVYYHVHPIWAPM